MAKSVCIVSGGMDSATAMAARIGAGKEIIGVHFDYNQRTMIKERKSFNALMDFYKIDRRFTIDLSFFGTIGASALTDRSIAVPHEFSGGVPITYVPFRNGIFLSIAAAIAEKEGADEIVIGAVEEDSSGYPDCREDFLRSIEGAIALGTRDETNIALKAPLVHLSKMQIVSEAVKLKVPLNLTWSCYENDDLACGICESCQLRLKGFALAGVADPIDYVDK
ncbi:7-cyano-7-deazaguanine synthase [Campylobacterota bacterium]|nr:7-cyano-7-deazaguanine synthase [Campylobacterota bacterium]